MKRIVAEASPRGVLRVFALMAMLSPAAAEAQTIWEGNFDSNFLTNGNWSQGAPSPFEIATLNNGSLANQPVLSGNTTVGAVILSAGSLTIGTGGTLTAPTTTVSGTGSLVVQSGGGINGAIQISGGALAIASGVNLVSATATLNGGTVALQSSASIGPVQINGGIFANAGRVTGNATISGGRMELAGGAVTGLLDLDFGTVRATANTTLGGAQVGVRPGSFGVFAARAGTTLQLNNAAVSFEEGSTTTFGSVTDTGIVSLSPTEGFLMSNNYEVIVAGGTLRMTNSSAGTILGFRDGAAVAVQTGAAVDLAGFDTKIVNLSGGGSIRSETSGAVTVETRNSVPTTFSGIIQNSSGVVALNKTGDSTLTLTGSNTYSGGTTIRGGRLNVQGSGTIGSGSLTLVGGTLGISGLSAGTFTQTGTLSGHGRIDATDRVFALAGILDPTVSLGPLEVLGDFKFETTASANFAVNGVSPGLFDQLDVSGTLTLGGILNLTTGYAAEVGDTVKLFDGGITGSFSEINGLELGNGLTWDPGNLTVTGEITVVPEPGTLFLLAGAAFVTLLRRSGGLVACRRPS